MTAVENEGFEAEGSDQEKMEGSFELKELAANNDTMVKLESEKEEKMETDINKNSALIKWNLKARAWLTNIFFGKNKTTKFLQITLVNALAVAILAMSIVKYDKTEPVDWCDGVGFLWIMYCLVYFGILYCIGKRLLGKFGNNSWKQVSEVSAWLAGKRYFRWFCYAAPVLGLAAFVIFSPGKSGRRKYSFLGMIVFVAFGFIFSRHPGHIKWRPVVCGMVFQFVFGLIVIRVEVGRNVMDCLGKKVTNMLQYTEEGTSFVYGYLGKPESDAAPIFAFTVLPVVFFLSFFINILSYYGALQWFIINIGWVVEKCMGTTVCESINAAASIFLGMTEAPLLIQRYLKDLTKSEICAILCAGWSTVAGVVLAAYVKFGVKASHIIAASVMSAPAALSYSKLFYPETEKSKNTTENIVLHREKAANALDAASQGALKAVEIIGGITANIIAFLAFIAFIDGTLNWIGAVTGFEELSFQYLMSKVFYPITFLMGVDENSLEDVAYLVGIKTVANEFQAYQELGKLIKSGKLSERSEIIATYALCGFSNFSSVGITIGAISTIEPKQSSTATQVALPAFIAANIVCFLTACVAGCLID